MNYSVQVLYDGYSRMENEKMRANCTCTLIKGPINVIVDTMTAWDKNKILEGEPYKINEFIEVIPTPGHTTADVSVVVKTQNQGTVVIAGDLFEREEDIADPSLWKYVAGSENPDNQEKHRNNVLLLADYIVPGHGPMFKVTPEMKKNAKTCENNITT